MEFHLCASRAPGNQFRQNNIDRILLEASVYQMFGVGVGGSCSIGDGRLHPEPGRVR